MVRAGPTKPLPSSRSLEQPEKPARQPTVAFHLDARVRELAIAEHDRSQRTPEALERSGWNRLDGEARKAREAAGFQAWVDWGTANAAAIVDRGSPLGKTKSASPEGITDIKNALAAYVIVRAETHEAAARLFENHPHFTIFPGDSVEIMECLPMPTR